MRFYPHYDGGDFPVDMSEEKAVAHKANYLFGPYDRPNESDVPLEYHPDEGKVETEGYIPADRLIESMIQAGERLVMFRGEEYGPDEEIPFDAPASGPVNMVDGLQRLTAIRPVQKAASPVQPEKVDALKEQEVKKDGTA